MDALLRLTLLIPLTLTSFFSYAVQYDISINSTKSSIVDVKVNTQSLGAFQVQPSRTAQSDFQPQLTCVTSNGKKESIQYGEDVTCDSVNWQLSLVEVDKTGFDIAAQNDTFSPKDGWYFISEFNSLPRFHTSKSQNIEALVCPPEGQCETLPSDTQPPLFLVWGLNSITLAINENTVTFFSDNPEILSSSDQWLPVLSQQLKYLSHVFPNAPTKSWNIATFSRDRKAGSVSGAAGSNMILINLLVDENTISERTLQLMVKIAAHESTHILGTQNMPMWAAESIAEYYAYHSINQTRLKTKTPIQDWRKFKKVFPYATTGLLEASTRVTKDGQYQYYPLFYVKGAAFWQSVNEALESKGSNLDSLVNDMSFDKNGHLKPSFSGKIVDIIGDEKWTDLSDLFL